MIQGALKIHLVPENFQAILFLSFFSQPLELLRLPLLPSLLQHICPKQDPGGSREEVDVSPNQDQRYLLLLTQQASGRRRVLRSSQREAPLPSSSH